MKIGRNQVCPCGSGIKYKKCCGILKTTQIRQYPHRYDILEQINADIECQKVSEMVRRKQQGLGNPIVSFELDNHRFIASGGDVYYSENWKTFPDFLFDYLPNIIGKNWFEKEKINEPSKQHLMLQWHTECNIYRKKKYDPSKKIIISPTTGAVCCYLGLAYNLYLLKHNIELQSRFIERIKDQNQFQGAYYELILAGTLILSGFELTLEDETSRKNKHCEFSAISKKTGKKYWVEAKMRSVVGQFNKTDNDGCKADADPNTMLIKHLNKALQKPANDERLIFIDINYEPHIGTEEPVWAKQAHKKLTNREKTLKKNEYAYVFVTNMCFHKALMDQKVGHTFMVYGLNIIDFMKPGTFKPSELYHRKQKHIDIYDIAECLRNYPKFPTTFEGQLPSIKFHEANEPLVIGNTYKFENIDGNDIVGKVTCATVDQNKKILIVGISTNEGCKILTKEMSDEEIADYSEYPEAFEGSNYRKKELNTVLDIFEFLYNSFKNKSKEQLLLDLKDSNDIDELKKLSREQLVCEYCDRLTMKFYYSNGNPNELGAG